MSHHHNHQNRNHSRQEDAAKFGAPPVLPPISSETDPVFATSEAALLVPGDKAKLAAAAPLANPTFTGTVAGVTKAMVGLGNVPNLDATNAGNISSGTLDDARLSATVTRQGNAFNGAGQLLQLDGTGKLPAVDGSQLTNLPGGSGGGGGSVAHCTVTNR